MTRKNFSLAIWTEGTAGSMTKPSHVLTWAISIFFQLSGVPKERSTSMMAVAISPDDFSLSSQRKSSTKTNCQSSAGKSE